MAMDSFLEKLSLSELLELNEKVGKLLVEKSSSSTEVKEVQRGIVIGISKRFFLSSSI
jgi:hypothetical protein